MEYDAITFNKLLLTHIKDMVDKRLEEINAICKLIILDRRVKSLLSINKPLSEGSPDYYKVWTLCSYLTNYRLTNDFIEDFYIIFKDADVAVSSSTTLVNKPYIYGQETWWNYFYNNSYIYTPSFVVNGQKKPSILYIQSFPIDCRTNPKAVLIISIKKQAIDQLLADINIGSTGMVQIYNKDGQTITGLCGDQCVIYPTDIQIDDQNVTFDESLEKEMIITTVRSPYNGWWYVSVVPRYFIMAKVEYIKELIIKVSFFVLLLGIMLGCYFAYKNAKPLGDIVSLLKDVMGYYPPRRTNDIKFLHESVLQLVTNNVSLRKSLNNQIEMLRAMFWTRLFNRSFSNKKELDAYKSLIGLDITQHDVILLLIAKINEYESMTEGITAEGLNDIMRIIRNNLSNQFQDEILYIDNLDIKSIVVVFKSHTDDVNKCKMFIEEAFGHMQKEIEEKYGVKLICIGGETGNEIVDIGVWFQEIKRCIDYGFYNRDKIITWHNMSFKESTWFYYPIDLELKLINLINAGNEQEVQRMLAILYEENFINRQLSETMLRHLTYDISATIFKAIEHQNNNDIKKLIVSLNVNEGKFEDAFEKLRDILVKICQQNSKEKLKYKESFSSAVIHYLEEVYMDENLNLSIVASKFGVRESYIYHFFKDHIGMTFADYLERLRIRKACELLSNNEMTIEEISKKVGYSNPHTFRRAFKRMLGVSPSSYRGSIICEKMEKPVFN